MWSFLATGKLFFWLKMLDATWHGLTWLEHSKQCQVASSHSMHLTHWDTLSDLRMTWAAWNCLKHFQAALMSLPTIIYCTLAPTYPLNKLVSNTQVTTSKCWVQHNRECLSLWWVHPSSQIADHNMFKLGHFPIVHFEHQIIFPYQKVSTFKGWSEGVSLQWRFPWVAHQRKYSQHKNNML